ncbi:MAG TPA: TonB-dependent receptor, partial [Gemmatimonadaceae bacterium]|nr:TonB-dependent receptor [Gemmatimonadaceae bacterium]
MRSVLVAAGIIASANGALAQGADTALARLPAVAVTATRSELPAKSQPISVTVFDRAAINASGARDVADLLRLVPGASVVSSGSFGSQTALFMRGGESDYVQVLVDGVPLNTPGGAYDFGQLTLDNIERVEVVRGPASVLYGSDAVSGVVQIFTRTGSRSPGLTGHVGGGTYGTWDYGLGAIGGRARLQWSLDATRHLTNGIYPFNSFYRDDVLSGAWRLRGARGDLGMSTRITKSTFHYPTNSAGVPEDSNAFTHENREVLSADGGWKLTQRVTLRARAAHDLAQPSTTDLADNAADQDVFTSKGSVTRNLLEGRAIVRIHDAHELTLSVDRARDHEVSSFHSESAFGPFDGDLTATRTTTGIAGQLLGNLGKKSTYTVGLRRDDNSAFGEFTTWRLAAATQLSPTVSVRASGGTAFKAPSFFENFATGFVTGNPGLTPERTRTFEAGLEYSTPSRRGTLGVTAFAQRFRDLIQYVSVVPANTPNYANLAAASANGVETELA